ncbi:MAG: hypothetical protein ACI9CO_001464 [Candidatus Azotimanducaceae bacterium]|jgi:hypothetical protein
MFFSTKYKMINPKQENSMFRHSLFAVVLLASASALGIEVTTNAHAVFNYDVFAENDYVGDTKVRIIKMSHGGYQILENTSIQAEDVWGETSIHLTANEQYSLENNLVEADIKTYNQTRAYWTKIDSLEENLWIHFSEIENQTQKEESEIVGLSMAVLNGLVPTLGEAIGVSQLLFSDKKAEPISIRLPKNSYHTTLAHLPKYWSIQQKKLPAKINILDRETISVLHMDVEDRGLEVMSFNGTKVSTNHYILVSKNRAPLNIWLAVNENNTPYFFQLKGEDEDGFFTIKLKL